MTAPLVPAELQPTEKVHFWQALEYDGLELLRATYRTHTFSRHIHETFAIGVIEQGAERFYYRGANHQASAGQIVVVEPGEIHTGEAETAHGWSYRMFYPSVSLIQQIANELELHYTGVPHFPQPVLNDPTTAAMIRQLHHVLDAGTSRLERDVHLRQAFGALLLRHHQPRPLPDTSTDRQTVNIARDYLEAHYSENIALETLAGVAGVSPFHLARLFRAQTGLPPHAYLVHVRVRQAKRLLAQGESITQAALATGFTDQSHLTRWFKRIMGVTPGQYAR